MSGAIQVANLAPEYIETLLIDMLAGNHTENEILLGTLICGETEVQVQLKVTSNANQFMDSDEEAITEIRTHHHTPADVVKVCDLQNDPTMPELFGISEIQRRFKWGYNRAVTACGRASLTGLLRLDDEITYMYRFVDHNA